jgi:benzylsuccinate CoA-transferase BbsE subunit
MMRSGALSGTRVIDMADRRCVYGTKVLSDLGAEVIRVEPASGDPLRRQVPLAPSGDTSLFNTFMNVNKNSVSINLQTSSGQSLFRRLVASADIVFESFAPGELATLGIGPEVFMKEKPALVWVSVTPFGDTGPRREWMADDLVSQAMGGLMYLSGLPGRPPLRLFGEQTCYIAGLHAASGALTAFYHAMMTGVGQRVDVSIQECVTHTLENAIQWYTAEGHVREREPADAEVGTGVYPCRDGSIYIFATTRVLEHNWHNLVAWMREESVAGADELTDPKWNDLKWRRSPEGQFRFNDIIGPWLQRWTKNEFYEQAQRRNILSAPVNTVDDVLENPQLKFFNWFIEQNGPSGTLTWPGAPYRFSETPARAPGRVAGAGEDNVAVFGALGISEAELRQYVDQGAT